VALSQDLLDILACPKCKGELRLTDQQDGLVCEACKLRYPIKDDIPIMLIDEAESLGWIAVWCWEPVRQYITMRPATHRGLRGPADAPLAGFQKFELGRRVVYLRRDLAVRAPAIVASLSELGSAEGAGNRLSGVALKLDDGTGLFARISRRGGLVRLILKDLYVGMRARPVRELEVAAEARRRGIPVAEPIGAMVEWVAPFIYRSAFLTRALPGMTLWKFLRTDDEALVRTHVIEQARQALDTMHRQGLFHADLNLHNLFVTKVHESFAVTILDLDKAQFFRAPLPARMRARNLGRLRQSARKLDPEGRYLDSRAVELLTREWRLSPLMNQQIIAFCQDEFGDWLAELACNHFRRT
jgi:uncharacterized protein